MTDSALALNQSYNFHGIAVDVSAATPAVAAALELRLRPFRSGAGPDSGVRLEFVVDDQGTELVRPPGSARPVYDTPYGEVEYVAEQDTLWADLDGMRMLCEATRGVARFASPAFDGRDLYLATHPMATIALMELLKRRRRYALHAGCLAAEGGEGVLLAGPTGAGKSTLTIALARAGLGFLSDDTVFLEHDLDADTVVALGFPDALGLSDQTAGRFAELRPLLDEPAASGFPKRLARIDELIPTARPASCSPRVLVLPEVVPGGASRLEPLDPKEAWLRLVPDVLLTEPQGTQAHLRAIAALLEQVDCYSVQSGADLEATARLVLDVL